MMPIGFKRTGYSMGYKSKFQYKCNKASTIVLSNSICDKSSNYYKTIKALEKKCQGEQFV